MIESNWLSRTTGGLVIAVPLIAFAAPPVPDHSHQLQDSIPAGNCVDGPSATTCVSLSTATGYDRFSGTLFNSYFDLSESRYLVGGGFTVRFIFCSVLFTTLSVDKNGATLAETPLDPSSPECFTSGYSFINGVFDDSYGGFQRSCMSVQHSAHHTDAPGDEVRVLRTKVEDKDKLRVLHVPISEKVGPISMPHRVQVSARPKVICNWTVNSGGYFCSV